MKKLLSKTGEKLGDLKNKLYEKKGDLNTQLLGLMILSTVVVSVLIAFLIPTFRENILPTVRDRLIGLFS